MSSAKPSASEPSAQPAGETVAIVLRAVATAVKGWSAEDIQAFVDGDLELVVRAPRRSANRAKHARPTDMLDAAGDVVRALDAMDSREEGALYLQKAGFTRDELRALVVAMDLPIARSDTVERLRHRIVESLIGYKLRSEAIRGRGAEAGTAKAFPADRRR